MKEDIKKAEARNAEKDYHECLEKAANELGHGGGYTEWAEVYYDDFDQMEKLYRKASELYASLREAQAVANYKERVKAKVDTAGWSMLSPMLTPYQTEDVMNQIKELLDTTN
jgi:hypothetical protein